MNDDESAIAEIYIKAFNKGVDSCANLFDAIVEDNEGLKGLQFLSAHFRALKITIEDILPDAEDTIEPSSVEE